MTAKFDPAPHDKHADNPNNPAAKVNAALEAGLAGSFPASDPVSVVQPAPSRPSARGHFGVAKDHDTLTMRATDPYAINLRRGIDRRACYGRGGASARGHIGGFVTESLPVST
jgi:hypothetical protein